MATITESKDSRTGSSEGLGATRYVRKFDVLITSDDLPVGYGDLSHEEQTRFFPSPQGLVRNNAIPWGDRHPWNSAALAVRWFLAQEVSPMHFIVAVEYIVNEFSANTIGQRDVPDGWLLRISGATFNRELLQELPPATAGKPLATPRGGTVVDLAGPRIIGPPKFDELAAESGTRPADATHQYSQPDGTIVWLKVKNERDPLGVVIEEPMAIPTLTRRLSNFSATSIGPWVGRLGQVNSVRFLGAPARTIRFKTFNVTPEAGDLNVTTDTGTISRVEASFEWRPEPHTPFQVFWFHTRPDGSKALVQDLNGNEVLEGFKVAKEFDLNDLFRIS